VFPLRDLNPTRITPFVTLMLIAASLGVYFFIQAVDSLIEQQEFLFRRAAISCEITTGSPLSIGEITTRTCGVGGTPLFPNKSELLAVLTSMFLHGSIGHVVFNMWFLWIFGNNVEEGFGHVRYLLMYLAGGLAATATFVFLNPESTVPLVGASGAIAAVLGSYAVLFPGHRVLSLLGWFVLPVPAAIFLGIWFVVQLLFVGGNVAWEAHVGGFIFGFGVTLFYRRRALRRIRLAR
jgi:membrane associated rhomboid family serine protease